MSPVPTPKNLLSVLSTCAVLCALPISFVHAQSAIIHVPADFPTIQEAILASSDGDTVLVAPGTYYENLDFHGRSIVLTSAFFNTLDTSFICNTIINGSQPMHPDTASCIIINGVGGTPVVQGFTITGGTGTKWLDPHGAGTYREGGGILSEFSSPIIQYNIIDGNIVTNTSGVSSTGGGAIRCGDGAPIIRWNTIRNNQARYGCGVVLNYCTGKVINNLITGNSGGQSYGGGGVWLTGQSTATNVTVENNTIVGNAVTGSGANGGKAGGIYVFTIHADIRNNIVWGNSQSAGAPISTAYGGQVTVTYSDVQGGFTGTGNIDADPLFMPGLEYILGAGSPCIDAGDPDPAYDDVSSGGLPVYPAQGGLRNDMGCYGGLGERPVPTCELPDAIGDLTGHSELFSILPSICDQGFTITAQLPVSVASRYRVFDMHGAELLRGSFSGQMTYVDTEALRQGCYMVTVESGSDYRSVRKLMVAHVRN